MVAGNAADRERLGVAANLVLPQAESKFRWPREEKLASALNERPWRLDCSVAVHLSAASVQHRLWLCEGGSVVPVGRDNLDQPKPSGFPGEVLSLIQSDLDREWRVDDLLSRLPGCETTVLMRALKVLVRDNWVEHRLTHGTDHYTVAYTWDAPPHTMAKIEILRRYLRAWFPILGSWSERIHYIDGFAGPGRYTDNRDGSPVAALEEAVDHKWAELFKRTRLDFSFVESSAGRATFLKHVLNERFPETTMPPNIFYAVHNKSFARFMEENVLRSLEAQPRKAQPTFLFVDPFGWQDVSMEQFGRFLNHSQTEVLLTFMYNRINQYLSNPSQAKSFDMLFGSDRWRSTAIIREDPELRKQHLLSCMVEGFKSVAGAPHVLTFEMFNHHNLTTYFLVHASTDPKLSALKAMKRAMWKVDPTFTFSDRTHGQLTLLPATPDYEDVRSCLMAEFAGRVDVTWDEIERFILLGTQYLDTHFNQYGLRVLELQGHIEVIQPPGANRPKGRYPDQLRPHLRFRFRPRQHTSVRIL